MLDWAEKALLGYALFYCSISDEEKTFYNSFKYWHFDQYKKTAVLVRQTKLKGFPIETFSAKKNTRPELTWDVHLKCAMSRLLALLAKTKIAMDEHSSLFSANVCDK